MNEYEIRYKLVKKPNIFTTIDEDNFIKRHDKMSHDEIKKYLFDDIATVEMVLIPCKDIE